LVGAALLLTASGTIVGLTASQRGTGRAGTPDATRTAPVQGAASAPRITITPPDGAAQARPDLGVVVKVANGTLADVAVSPKTGEGERLPGLLSPDGTSWRTRWTLAPGRSYAVRATSPVRHGHRRILDEAADGLLVAVTSGPVGAPVPLTSVDARRCAGQGDCRSRLRKAVRPTVTSAAASAVSTTSGVKVTCCAGTAGM
jgi:Big-like domain-containing protein